VESVVEKVALGQDFSEYFDFPRHSIHRLLHTHHYPSSGAGKIGQIVAELPSGLGLAQKSDEIKFKTDNINGFEVPTAVVMKNPVFCDITSCFSLKVNRRLEEHVAFILRVSYAGNQQAAGSKKSTRF
jgi:hypothetical protein